MLRYAFLPAKNLTIPITRGQEGQNPDFASPFSWTKPQKRFSLKFTVKDSWRISFLSHEELNYSILRTFLCLCGLFKRILMIKFCQMNDMKKAIFELFTEILWDPLNSIFFKNSFSKTTNTRSTLTFTRGKFSVDTYEEKMEREAKVKLNSWVGYWKFSVLTKF